MRRGRPPPGSAKQQSSRAAMRRAVVPSVLTINHVPCQILYPPLHTMYEFAIDATILARFFSYYWMIVYVQE